MFWFSIWTTQLSYLYVVVRCYINHSSEFACLFSSLELSSAAGFRTRALLSASTALAPASTLFTPALTATGTAILGLRLGAWQLADRGLDEFNITWYARVDGWVDFVSAPWAERDDADEGGMWTQSEKRTTRVTETAVGAWLEIGCADHRFGIDDSVVCVALFLADDLDVSFSQFRSEDHFFTGQRPHANHP